MSRGRAAGGRRGRRGLSWGPKGSRQLERRRPCSSLLRWRPRGQEKWARGRGARPGVAGQGLSGEGLRGSCGRRQQSRPVDADGGWGLSVSSVELPAHQPGSGRQEMRFLRQGAGPGGLPGGERKYHGLCRWVGGPGAWGRQWGGRTQAPGSSPHTPNLPSHPVQGWLVGCIWQPPGGR